MLKPDKDLITRFTAIVGEKYALTDPDLQAAYLHEMRDRWVGTTPLVLRPGPPRRFPKFSNSPTRPAPPIVPQGGNTGLVGGQIPHHNEIVLSLNRMTAIREIDPITNTITVEAGATLQRVRDAAAEADRLYPQLLPSEGSCTIGGNLSTNAGGTAALAHGVARSHALGLEVVLADGRVLHNLNKLKKDNTGYDLKNCSSAPKARSASSPRRCCGWCRGRARSRSPFSACPLRRPRSICSASRRRAQAAT